MKHNYCTPKVEIVFAEFPKDVLQASNSAENEAITTEEDTNWW